MEAVIDASNLDASNPEALWERVVGQDDVVARLRRAASDPTHAYLFVGLPGTGTHAAALAFAAELLCRDASPDEAERHRRLAAREQHPAITIVRRTGASISADQARDIVRQAQMRPAEGDLQVFVLTEFHLVAQAAPILLKSIEEPPPGTVFIVLADEVTPDLVTIASRCVRFEFPILATPTIAEQLRREGVPGDVADAAAVGSGGDLDRARLLATDPFVVARRQFWMDLPTRLDGTGATVARLVGEALGKIDEVLAPLAERHAAELAVFAEQAERAGTTKGALKEIEARHKREQRRVRTDELRAGLAALLDAYRAGAASDPTRYVEAAERVGEFTANLVHNPNEELALWSLFLSLPRPG